MQRFDMKHEVYLDNSATTRQYDEVISLMADIASNKYGNPSSLHTRGIEAEKIIRSARETIASTLRADPGEIIFTSGGTEANNLAIRGYLDANPRAGRHLITTKIEHPSVLEVYRHLESQGYRVDYLDVDENGHIVIEQLKEKICSETAIISVILVNNETGTIQNIEDIAAARDALNPGTVIHADAVQAYGKIRIMPSRTGIDLLSISYHKIHGPMGVGALYASKRIKLKPLLFGGGQESLMRSGTENVPGIAGFGLAARMTFEKIDENFEKVASLKRRFIEGLASTDIAHHVNSPQDALPYIINIAFENVRAEVLLHHLEQKGIYVSTGSACSSHKKNRSHVLSSMNIPPQLIDGSVRFSLSGDNNDEEMDLTVKALEDIIPVININRGKRSGRK